MRLTARYTQRKWQGRQTKLHTINTAGIQEIKGAVILSVRTKAKLFLFYIKKNNIWPCKNNKKWFQKENPNNVTFATIKCQDDTRSINFETFPRFCPEPCTVIIVRKLAFHLPFCTLLDMYFFRLYQTSKAPQGSYKLMEETPPSEIMSIPKREHFYWPMVHNQELGNKFINPCTRFEL